MQRKSLGVWWGWSGWGGWKGESLGGSGAGRGRLSCGLSEGGGGGCLGKKGGRGKALGRPRVLAMPDLLREPASTGRAASATEHGSEPEVGGCATSLCVEGWRGGQPCWPCKRAARPSRWRLIGGPLDPRQSTSGSGARRSRAPGRRTVHEETARSQVRSRCS